MIDSIQLTLWSGVQLYDETVVLADESHYDFIRQAHEVFRPYSLSGLVCESRPEIHRVVRELIAAGDFISLEPSLYTRQFQGRDWGEVSVTDGAFALQCFPWATDEEWIAFMPWMIEFALRADRRVDSMDSFLYFLNPSHARSGHLWSDRLSAEACDLIVAFIDRLYAKYSAEEGSIDSYGSSYSMLVGLIELREWWASRKSPN